MKVLLADPTFDSNGLAMPYIPIASGLIGAFLQQHHPTVELKILKGASQIVEYLERESPDILGLTNYLWNTALVLRLARYARKINPDILIVIGGPEIDPEPLDQGAFCEKYAIADVLVQLEGEVAFKNIIDAFVAVGRNRKKLRPEISRLGNCFCIEEGGRFVIAPTLPRFKDFVNTPSPYSTGLFDEFLKDPSYIPLIITTRGCPYVCTFCTEGLSYFSKVHTRPQDKCIAELDYIVERVTPSLGLMICDANFGMYSQDVEIARHLSHLQTTKNWPMSITVSTGKSQPERIKFVVDMLHGALPITRAVQSLNPEVLDIVKRKNLPSFVTVFSEYPGAQNAELILPLPGETKETFIKGLRGLQDSVKQFRVSIYPSLLLNNTEMAKKDCVERYGIKAMFRPHQNLAGVVAGEFVCEVERSIVSTSSMSFEDVLFCREYALLLDALLRGNSLAELFLFLQSQQIANSEFTTKLFERIPVAPIGIQSCFEEFRLSFIAERFDTEEETVAFIKQHAEDYRLGLIGGDLLKYSMQLWIEHFEQFLEWIFSTVECLRTWDESARAQIKTLRNYLLLVYYDRWNEKGPLSVSGVFEYDINAWSQSAEAFPLDDFAGSCEYFFLATSESLSTKKAIWQSFGFFLEDGGESQNMHHEGARLYMNRTKRLVSVAQAGSTLRDPSHRPNHLDTADQATIGTLERPFRWS